MSAEVARHRGADEHTGPRANDHVRRAAAVERPYVLGSALIAPVLA